VLSVRQLCFREQLLSHAEYETFDQKNTVAYLNFLLTQMSLLNTCKINWQVASVVDEICAVDKQFTINKRRRTCRIPSLSERMEELGIKIRALMPERSI